MTTRRAQDIATLRTFNRTYTSRLGLLNAHLDGSPFTLSEARVLYELSHQTEPTGAKIARAIRLDPAQISRTIKRFVNHGLVEAREDPSHGRHQLLSLTKEGRVAFATLDQNTQTAIDTLLEELPPFRRGALLSAAGIINRIFEDGAPRPILRGLRPGDLGLVTARQAILYAKEYGWDANYEALVAHILAEFQRSFDPDCEAAWIADMDERMVGSVFLMKGDTLAIGKLRLLYVEPEARGAGVGRMLVANCIGSAREFGYKRLDLWTNSVLAAARSIYERAGFVLIDEAPHHSFGKDLVGQTWSLAL